MLHAVADRLAAALPDLAPDRGLIHADLHRGNVVETPAGRCAVIDFDDCGYGPLMLDVATALSSAYRACPEPGAYARFARRYLAAYTEVRTLPDGMEHLQEYLVLRDLVIVNFLASSRNPTVATYGPVRAAGIIEQLRRWLAGDSYPGTV